MAVRALEDPDLIRHCGDAKALALGLSSSKHHGAEGIAYGNNHVHSAPEIKYESYNIPTQTHGYIHSDAVQQSDYQATVQQADYQKSDKSGSALQSGYSYPVPGIRLSYPSANLHQHGHHGYAVSAGLSNYANQKSSINHGNIHSYTIPSAKTYLPPVTKSYVAPIAHQTYSTLAYAQPNIKSVTKLTSIPSLAIYKSQSESSYSDENSYSSSQYISAAPAVSLHTHPVYNLPIHTATISKQIHGPQVSYSKENFEASSHSSYSAPVIKYSAAVKTISQPIVYSAPSVTYSGLSTGSADYQNSAESHHNSKSSDSSSAIFSASPPVSSHGHTASITYSSPVNQQIIHTPVHKVVAAPAVTGYVSTPAISFSGGLQSYVSGLQQNRHASSHDSSQASSSGPVAQSTVSFSNGNSHHHSGGLANPAIQTYHHESKPVVNTVKYSSAPDVSSSQYISAGHDSGNSGNQHGIASTGAHTTYVTPVIKTSVKTAAKPIKIKHSEYYVSCIILLLYIYVNYDASNRH